MAHRLVRPALAAALGLAAIALPSTAEAQASPSAYTSATRYDASGRVTGTISPDPDGVGSGNPFLATRNTYDARGNPIKVETGTLSTWQSHTVAPASWGTPAADGDAFTAYTTAETTYDALNRKLTERVKGSDLVTVSLTQYSYDTSGRLQCTAVRMNPNLYASLPSSACDLATPEGSHGPDRITKNIYDAAGQLLQVRTALNTTLESAEVTYTYTDNGKQKFVIDANGNKAELRYDGHDRQVRWVFPSTTKPSSFNDSTPANAVATAGALNEADYELYGYDANGNRTSLRKRDGSTLTYAYDNLNRMTVKVVPERSGLDPTYTRDVYYEYDLRGLQTKARFDSLSGEGVTTAYDGFGRKTSETLAMDGQSRQISHLYDKGGSRTRVTWPDSAYFTYGYDGLNRLNLVQSSSLTSLVQPSYNARGLLAATTRPSMPADQAFTYDPVGRLSGSTINNAAAGVGASWTFTRNPASQILTDTRNNDAYAWPGDPPNAVARSYTVNGLNQYSVVAGTNFTYDANGNLASDVTNIFQYDVENRLVWRATGAGTTLAYLRYDPLGRLYELYGSANGANTGYTRFLHDGDALVAEYDTSGTLLRRYVHGSDAGADDPLLWFEGTSTSFANARHLYADPRGSIVLTAGSTGAAIAINSYDEYGIPAAGNQGRFQYTGQAWLAELGMYYYKARIYSPTLGRFLQTDPIGYEDQWNLYAYVGNDPVNSVDFDGREAASITCMNNACGQSELSDEQVGNLVMVGAVAFDVLNTPISPGPDATIVVTASRASVEAAKRPGFFTRVWRAITGKGDGTSKAPGPYTRPSGATTRAQRAAVQGKPCVKCGVEEGKRVAGHKESLVREWHESGTIDRARMRDVDAVQPECTTCSARQGAEESRYSREMNKQFE